MFGSSPGLYSLDAGNTPQLWQPKMSLDVSKCTLERHLSKCICHCISITTPVVTGNLILVFSGFFLLDFFSLFETWFCLGCLRWGLSLLPSYQPQRSGGGVIVLLASHHCAGTGLSTLPTKSAPLKLMPSDSALLPDASSTDGCIFLPHHGKFGTWLALLFLLHFRPHS